MTGFDDRELQDFGRGLRRYASLGAPSLVRARLRASLLAAPVEFAAARPSVARWTWPAPLRPAFAAAVVLVVIVAGTASAAAASLPGVTSASTHWYLAEGYTGSGFQTWVLLLNPGSAAASVTLRFMKEDGSVVTQSRTVSPHSRLNVLVTQSDRRLVDLETTAGRHPKALVAATDEYLAAVARVDAALTRLATEPRAPARDTAIASAALASADHLARLEALAASLPSAAQHGIQRAIEVQLTVHGKAGEGRRGGSPLLPADRSPIVPSIPVQPPALPALPPGRGSPAIGLPGRP